MKSGIPIALQERDRGCVIQEYATNDQEYCRRRRWTVAKNPNEIGDTICFCNTGEGPRMGDSKIGNK